MTNTNAAALLELDAIATGTHSRACDAGTLDSLFDCAVCAKQENDVAAWEAREADLDGSRAAWIAAVDAEERERDILTYGVGFTR